MNSAVLDILDILIALPPRGNSGPEASPREQRVAVIAYLVFPALLFCLMVFADLWQAGVAVSVLLGVAFSTAGFFMARRASERESFAIQVGLLGAIWNFVGLGAGFLLAALMSFYSAF